MEKIRLSDHGYRILQIESTAACNMECSFCPYPLKEDKVSKLSLERIKNIIDQIDAEDPEFKYITFSQYNEPLLDSRIFEIMEYAQKAKLPVHLITNGLLLNKEKNVENIFRFKPTVKISLQVLDSSKHMGARGLKLELDRYVKTIIDFCVKAKGKNLDVTVDIGSNYSTKFKKFLKNILGLSTGDPSVPNDLKTTILQFKQYMNLFYEASDEKYKENLKKLLNFQEVKKIFAQNYLYQEGFKIFENVTLKIKPFFYGRRISDFEPRDDKFSCGSEILAVLADGNVVPCCLTYDDSISLGKINNSSLKKMIVNNKFLSDLRNVNSKKHITCRKCFGEPTKRGLFFKKFLGMIPEGFYNSRIIQFIKEN